MIATKKVCSELLDNDENCYSIKRIFDKDNVLSMIQAINFKGGIYKCLFYRDGKFLSNMSIYNPETGKEIKNITYRNDGKTISSVREYDFATERLLTVTFFKEDGVSVSSIIEYDESGTEVSFQLFCDDGEVITQSF